MSRVSSQWIKDWLQRLLPSPGVQPEQWAARSHRMERDVILPARAAAVFIIYQFLFGGIWFDQPHFTREVAVETIRSLFLSYVALQILFGTMLVAVKRFPPAALEWSLFTAGLLDGLLVAAMTLLTGGFDSILYWLFLMLIVRHSISLPQAAPQLSLNLSISFIYIVAGLIDVGISLEERDTLDQDLRKSFEARFATSGDPENPAEPFLLRVVVLLLTTACCYGVWTLLEQQRLAHEEEAELQVRRAQLKTASRISAEIAHRLKNPLSIITNAAFVLQRSLKNVPAQAQLDIIREEVNRSDRILTELMGYAKLADGKVEKLNVVEELNRAIDEVFPPAAGFKVEVRRNFAPDLPVLLMQRTHLWEIFVNLLQNAREAVGDGGRIEVSAEQEPGWSVIVTIADNGPGIPPERQEQIFESYFTTKEKGSGLGLAIVKHNVEIHGGTVRVESALGRGARFILTFPAKTLFRPENEPPPHSGRR